MVDIRYSYLKNWLPTLSTWPQDVTPVNTVDKMLLDIKKLVRVSSMGHMGGNQWAVHTYNSGLSSPEWFQDASKDLSLTYLQDRCAARLQRLQKDTVTYLTTNEIFALEVLQAGLTLLQSKDMEAALPQLLKDLPLTNSTWANMEEYHILHDWLEWRISIETPVRQCELLMSYIRNTDAWDDFAVWNRT